MWQVQTVWEDELHGILCCLTLEDRNCHKNWAPCYADCAITYLRQRSWYAESMCLHQTHRKHCTCPKHLLRRMDVQTSGCKEHCNGMCSPKLTRKYSTASPRPY